MRDRVVILLALAVLWAQLFYALSPAWGDGTYYTYGWYVPPLTLWFLWRRWKDDRPTGGTGWGGLDWVGLAGLLAVLLVVRVLGYVDIEWRLPMLVHAALVAVATFWWVRAAAGRHFAVKLVPVVVFALTAVPYPTVVEMKLVQGLTQVVVGTTVEVFHLLGKPVMAMGDRLSHGGRVVEVTEGCSGVRSFQSFLMAAVFFGELFRLKWPGRAALVLVGLVLAIAINVGRAFTLSAKGFADGTEAAAAIHDMVGLIAFALSALLFFVAAVAIERAERPRQQVSRRMVGSGGA